MPFGVFLAALAGLIGINLGAAKKSGLRPGLPDLNRILTDYIGRA